MTLCTRFLVIISFAFSSAVEIPNMMLNSGRPMPAMALGSYLGIQNNSSKDQPNVQEVMMQAIDIGYRHFDTAPIYNTEDEIGAGVATKIAEGTVKREDIFITTKLWNTEHRRERVPLALKKSLTKLKTDYVDLYLMHWPMGFNDDYTLSDVDYMETYRGLEDTVKLGLAKSIGVANFNLNQLQRVIKECSIKPAVLQTEVHIQNSQEELVTYAQSEGLVVMGYSPFASLVSRFGRLFPGPKMEDPVLTSIAKKYGKTTPQVVLRWLVEKNVVPIAKSVHKKRLEENINIFDFKLEKEEIDKISQFDISTRYNLPSFWQEHPYYPFEKIDNPVPNPFKS